MNKSYQSVWNSALGAWVATSEITSSRGKRRNSKRLAVATLLIGSAFTAYAGCADTANGGNWVVGATNGDTCHGTYSSYNSANTAFTNSGGVLIFDQPTVNINALGGGSIHGLGVNGNGSPNPNPNAHLSTIRANDLNVTSYGRGHTRTIYIGGQGTLNVAGTLQAARWGYVSTAATLDMDSGNLKVGKDLNVWALIDAPAGNLSGMRMTNDSNVNVGGKWYINTAQYQGSNADYKPGGALYDGELGAGTTGVLSGGNLQLIADKMELVTQQNRSNGWNHYVQGDTSSIQVTNEALITTYGTGSTGLNLHADGIGTNQQSVMALGAGTAPAAQAGIFQLRIGDKATFKALGDNNQALAFSTDAASTVKANLQIDAGAVFDLQKSNSTGVTLNHSGAGEVTLSNAATISTTAAAVNLSTSGAGNTAIVNSGTLTSSSTTLGALQMADASATAGTARTISIDNTGTISGSRSAIAAAKGEATTQINLSNSGQLLKTATDSNAVIDLSATQGSNSFAMKGGSVGTQLPQSPSTSAAYLGGSGADSITQTGGSLQGDVLTMAGNDSFTGTAGRLIGTLNMGDGNDTALIASGYDLSQTPRLDGGAGTNNLTLQGQSLNIYSAAADTPAQGVNVLNWQTLNLQNASAARLTGDLNLGGPAGQLNIDSTSSVAIAGAASTARTIAGSVNNAGTLDLRNSAVGALNTLTVQGNYVGNNGKLLINTQLGDSSSPTDKLIIDGGKASGNTSVSVTNKGGLGAQTTGTGIQVINAINGATTDAGAFALNGGTVSAGAYNYSLARNTDESWYLSSAVAPQPPAPSPSPSPSPSASPSPSPAPAPQQNYSPQTAVMAATPTLALLHGAATLDSWQERMGGRVYGYGMQKQQDQASPGWVRMIAQGGSRDGGKRYGTGTGDQSVAPGIDYSTYVAQLGMDFYRDQSGNARQAAGAFVALGQTSGDISFTNYGTQQSGDAGKSRVKGTTLGLYWSRIAQQGQYLDAVLQYTDYDIKTSALGANSTKSGGKGFGASIEGGVPFALNADWTLTPQAQLRWQHVSLNSANVVESGQRIGSYDFGSANSLWGRLGVQATYQTKPDSKIWVRADLMHEFKGETQARYIAAQGGPEPVFKNSLKGTAVGLTGGIDQQINKQLAVYGSLSYSAGVGGNKGDAWAAKAGMRWSW